MDDHPDRENDETHRVPFMAALLAHAVVWITAVMLWPQLPERFPTHFDFAGNPDRFSDRSWLAFFALPAITSFVTALVLGIALCIGRIATNHPQWINTPNKQKFLALDPARRRHAVLPAQSTLAWVAVYVNGLFLYILVGTERVANGAWKTLPSWPTFIFLGLVLSTVIVQAIAAHRRVRELSLEA